MMYDEFVYSSRERSVYTTQQLWLVKNMKINYEKYYTTLISAPAHRKTWNCNPPHLRLNKFA